MVRRLQGLVVVPTRDLAYQVFEVLQMLAKPAGLACGLVAGKEIEKVEAAALMSGPPGALRSAVDAVVATPGRLISHMKQTEGFGLHDIQVLVINLLLCAYHFLPPRASPFLRHLPSAQPRDPFICPLRRAGPGMHCSLPQVVDEADRLLRQSYNEWLPHVMDALPKSPTPANGVLLFDSFAGVTLRNCSAKFL